MTISVNGAATGLPGSTAEQTSATGRLGQEEFLQLMITQLKNQDPFKPLESGEFLGQLAQFGTVSGIADLQKSFGDLSSALVSNQALQAADLVGRNVLVSSSEVVLEAGTAVDAALDLGSSSSAVRVQIRDAAGQVVRTIELGAQSPGLVSFTWNGETDAGGAATPGRYSISAQYRDGNEMRGASTWVNATVESVAFGSRGLSVQLRGLGQLPFSAVREIS